jgi:hypothetical protein
MLSAVKRLLSEPLLHFLLLGALLFAVYELRRAPETRPGEIVVGAGQIEHLAATFVRFQQRPPTPDELQSLVDKYVREEVMSREAVKLGLDQDDSVIRQRLQQKLEFVATDLATTVEPTEDELAAWLAQHPGDFREDERLSFRQVCLVPEKHGDRLDGDLAALLATLRQSGERADIEALGDTHLLPQEVADAPLTSISAQFGADFGSQLASLPPSEWSGPVRSAYGAHAVLVTARTASRLPALDAVREQVAREVLSDRRQRADREFVESLLAKYHVTVEWPAAAASGQAPSAP